MTKTWSYQEKYVIPSLGSPNSLNIHKTEKDFSDLKVKIGKGKKNKKSDGNITQIVCIEKSKKELSIRNMD